MDCATLEEIAIVRGVRQWCTLSPLLFNLYSEEIFYKALNAEDGKINITFLIFKNALLTSLYRTQRKSEYTDTHEIKSCKKR